ncbi:hypothetical protein GTP58_20100 [Duganella sp. CY15W]|uniref:hypothetical protein n=1 Tax=Duganella sp. CY15W TaxID=2692172 RepID=UPI00136BB5B9|nr:hypothetical protein [Duganella sp. CY15W]MYM30639.1 hypothetical protein [Duganella sp. CY15W]
MKRRERDFIALFNALWYQDFPVIPGHEDLGRRAVWTTHIASTVKKCSDLMGLFTCFESGGRTDAVVQNANRETWAKVEWEWYQPKNEKVNEIHKLAAAYEQADAFIFIGYSRPEHHAENLAKIKQTWGNLDRPLIVILVTFSFHGKQRRFELVQTHYIKNGSHKQVRKQPALPWHVEGTKWAALSNAGATLDLSEGE